MTRTQELVGIHNDSAHEELVEQYHVNNTYNKKTIGKTSFQILEKVCNVFFCTDFPNKCQCANKNANVHKNATMYKYKIAIC